MKRREFLKLSLASALLASCGVWKAGGKVGLALGGGGARGLAHVPMLEVFDELKLRPHRIAGTSIGAVIGALYAAGMPGREIRALVDRLTVSGDESWLSGLFEQDVGRWWDFIELKLGGGGLVDSTAFARFIEETTGLTRFDQLGIPLMVVATDLWRREQVVFYRGDLRPALQASIAIPGLFNPLEHDGRVLVDGGLVNPVPYDLLFDDCDVVVAIDVAGRRTPQSDDGTGYFENLFNTIQVAQATIMREKMKHRPPHVYIKPELEDIRVLDFNRVDEIYRQASASQKRLRRALKRRFSV